MKLCSMLCGSLDGRGVWGRIDTCICTDELLPCSLETIKTLLISHIPTQNKKLKKEYLETNNNDNTTIQNLREAAKAVLRGKFKVIQAFLKKTNRKDLK